MPGRVYTELLERAHDQHGYLVPDQVREMGFDPALLRTMSRRGLAQKVAHGVYRIRAVPVGPLDQYMEATLWPKDRGVISHDSALDLHELCDVNPAKIHITVPSAYRVRREGPSVFVVHRRDLAPEDIRYHDGIRIVTPRRAILDAIEMSLGPQLIDQAIQTAAARGMITAEDRAEFRRLRGRNPQQANAG